MRGPTKGSEMKKLGMVGALGVGMVIGLALAGSAANADLKPIAPPTNLPLPTPGALGTHDIGPALKNPVLLPSQRLVTIRAALGPLGGLLNESNLEPARRLSAQTPYIDRNTFITAHGVNFFSPAQTADSDPYIQIHGYDGHWHTYFNLTFSAEANRGYFVDCQLLPGATGDTADFKWQFAVGAAGSTPGTYVSSSPVTQTPGHMFAFLTKAATPRQVSWGVIPQSLNGILIGACDVTAVRY